MKSLFLQLMRWLRGQLWSLIVAYMLGLHNFYTGDQKTPDDILITIEHNEVQEDGTPNREESGTEDIVYSHPDRLKR